MSLESWKNCHFLQFLKLRETGSIYDMPTTKICMGKQGQGQKAMSRSMSFEVKVTRYET